MVKKDINILIKKRGAAIPQWIRLRIPSCRPGFESQAYHLSFYSFIIVSCRKDENKQKRPGLAHLKKTNKKLRNLEAGFKYSNLIAVKYKLSSYQNCLEKL